MSALSLPYTVLILLSELAAGSLLTVAVFDARGGVTRGYVKTCALVVLPIVALAVLASRALGDEDAIDGFALRRSWLPLLRGSLLALLLLSAAYVVVAFRGSRLPAVVAGGAAAAVGALTLVALAGMVAGPTWSYAGTLGGMLAAALALGGALMAMMWGHWYLTNSGLPQEPMERMSLLVLAALGVQALFVLLGALLPVREVPLSDAAFGVTLGQNPAFWLRVGVGLVFPAVLATLAWRAATVRGMMSATGLLYIAVGTVLAGEVLARGLLFATGAAV
ncbi:MAG: hypothetical protein EXR65_00875 [Dehalococcoidia bacterium]|nr:hypothetical protein [Dehalococcoidia bacterium]